MLLIYSVLKFLTGREMPFLALETVVPYGRKRAFLLMETVVPSNGNSRFS